MKYKPRVISQLWVALLLLFTSTAIALAQTSASFDLSWNVFGSGGGKSTSANYHVNGTIGQSLAGQTTASSASYAVSSGYWSAGTRTAIYLPAIIKQ